MAYKYAESQYWSAVAYSGPQYQHQYHEPEFLPVNIAGVTFTQRVHAIQSPKTPTNKRLRARQSPYARRQHAALQFDGAESEQAPWLKGLDLGCGGWLVARQIAREGVWASLAGETELGFEEFTAEMGVGDRESVVQYEFQEEDADQGEAKAVEGMSGGEREGESGGVMRKVRKRWGRVTGGLRTVVRGRGFVVEK